jgi:hypothetical protein
VTALHCFILELLQLLNLYFDADLDPDPGASQIMRICIRIRKPDHNHTFYTPTQDAWDGQKRFAPRIPKFSNANIMGVPVSMWIRKINF